MCKWLLAKITFGKCRIGKKLVNFRLYVQKKPRKKFFEPFRDNKCTQSKPTPIIQKLSIP